MAAIENRKGAYPSDVITILDRSKARLEQLEVLLETKIITKIKTSPRVRRRAWARRKSKVYSIQSSLKEDRLNLVTALAAGTSYDTYPPDLFGHC